MATDREDKRAESFTNFEKGVRADEFIFGDRGYTEADMKILDEGVAYLLTGTDPPDPPTDPEAPPDALWNASVGNNKLEANLAISNYTTEITRAWIVVVDSDTVPTNDAVIGVSPPTGFTPGDWPTTNFLSSYASSEDWYFYEYDDVEGVVLVKTTTGTDFITIVPKDTLGAVWLSGTAGFDIDDNGAYTIVPPTDAGVGLAAAETYDIYVDDNIVLSKTTALTGSVSVAAGVHIAYAVARDESGNIGQSDEVSFTIATLTGGTVSLPLVTQEVAEDLGGATQVTLTRSGGTAPFTANVSTRDMTAEAGTNYTAISSEPVVFGLGDLTKTIDFTPADNSETTNKVCNIEIDFDTADVANGTVEVGTESVLMKIIGKGLTAFAGFQMTTAAPFYASIQAERANDASTFGGLLRNSIASGQTSDAWSYTSGTRYAEGWRITSNSSANSYGSATVLNPEGPYAEYQIHFTSEAVAANGATDLFDIFARHAHDTLTDTVGNMHVTLVNPITSIVWSAPDGGTATITMDYNAGASMAGNTVWLEDVTGDGAATYNAVAGLTVATHTLNTNVFTVTGVGADLTPDAGTGNVLGCDETALNLAVLHTPPVWTWLWTNVDEADNPIAVYVDEAATRYLRFYVYERSSDFDVFTVVSRSDAWTTSDVNILENGQSSESVDDDFGHVESSYSAASSDDPSDHPDNPQFPYVPLPDATVASLACS